jgi:hypothetical protein
VKTEKLKEDQTFNVLATFHLVVKVRTGESVVECLRDQTEYIAEPRSASGVVIAMNAKKFDILSEKGSKTIFEDCQEKPKATPVKKSDKKTCGNCTNESCSMLSSVCKRWKG